MDFKTSLLSIDTGMGRMKMDSIDKEGFFCLMRGLVNLLK